MKRLVTMLSALLLVLQFPPVSLAQETDDQGSQNQSDESSSEETGRTDTPATGDSTGNLQGVQTGTPQAPSVFASIGWSIEIPDDVPAVDAVAPKVAAKRESRVLSADSVYCADDSSSVGLGPLRNEDLAAHEAAAEAERRETEGASGEEILDFINGNSGAESSASSAKALKRPVRLGPPPVFAQDAEPVDVDAILDIFDQESDTENPGVPVPDGNGSGSGNGGGDGECDTPYVCAGERIDDVVTGRIDSEPSGAYAEYVTGVAVELDELTAQIRETESNAPGGELVSIPAPSSEGSVVSLMGVLAEQGLGDAPDDLHLPEFNYCRVGDGGPIETDATADQLVLPSFTWTAVVDEFDIDATSRSVLASIEAQLLGRLPDMRTIPPMDTGVTIVQFPMWLWLDDPLTFAAAEGTSESGHIRVRGRAFFDRVTWTLGEHELVCTLEDMVAFVPDSDMNVADTPVCHHIFTQLEEYTVTAAATYRIEQQVSVQLVPGLPFPETAWTPHPTTEFVTVENTSGPMRVEEIYSVNVPIEYTTGD